MKEKIPVSSQGSDIHLTLSTCTENWPCKVIQKYKDIDGTLKIIITLHNNIELNYINLYSAAKQQWSFSSTWHYTATFTVQHFHCSQQIETIWCFLHHLGI